MVWIAGVGFDYPRYFKVDDREVVGDAPTCMLYGYGYGYLIGLAFQQPYGRNPWTRPLFFNSGVYLTCIRTYSTVGSRLNSVMK